MDPGKTQNLEASLKVQSGPKTGRQLESLVQGVAGHISYSPNLTPVFNNTQDDFTHGHHQMVSTD